MRKTNDEEDPPSQGGYDLLDMLEQQELELERALEANRQAQRQLVGKAQPKPRSRPRPVRPPSANHRAY